MSKKLNFEKGLFIVLGLIISLLAVLSFLPNADNKVHAVGGDNVSTSYSFSGSNVFVPSSIYRNSSYELSYYMFDEFAVNSVYYPEYSDNYGTIPAHYTTRCSFGIVATYSGTHDSGTYNFQFHADNVNLSFSSLSSLGDAHISVLYFCEPDFNSNVQLVKFDNEYLSFDGVNSYYNTLTYYDNNGSSLSFKFKVKDNYSYLLFMPRTYYLSNSFSDIEYYSNGYSDGFSAGSLDGSQTGYNKGYSAGRTVGYAQGKTDGIASANEYTFNSLFGAVLDAPIQTLTGLLNFNLLGVNLLGLFTGLLTLAVIIFIVKLALGGK